MIAAPAKEPKTPWNPSRTATARVTGALPVPTICPNCGCAVRLVGNEAIYGRPFGDWPWAYKCDDEKCHSYVGLHPFTNIPLGTLADAVTREARKSAKAAFNPLWQSRRMTRKQAYAWLARALRIEDVNTCHIGWFGVEQCRAVEAAIKTRRKM